MIYSVGKIDAAVEQLDWAIRLFLDEKAYIPSITLAGASEEILGAVLKEKSSFSQLKIKLSQEYKMSEAIVSQAHLNKTKNWLKHWTNLADDEVTDIELEKENVQYIARALANLVAHDRSFPPQG